MIRLEPRLLIWSSTRACAPAPTPTIAITAATPMMMPSIVSAERSLLARSAASATLSVASSVMPAAVTPRRAGTPRASCGTLGARRATTLPSRKWIARVANAAMSCSCVTSTTVMPSRVELLQQRHHLEAGLRVERAGRLVGEDQASASLTSARAIATRCCWPPESCAGWWSARLPSPTRVSCASARSRRSCAETPA